MPRGSCQGRKTFGVDFLCLIRCWSMLVSALTGLLGTLALPLGVQCPLPVSVKPWGSVHGWALMLLRGDACGWADPVQLSCHLWGGFCRAFILAVGWAWASMGHGEVGRGCQVPAPSCTLCPCAPGGQPPDRSIPGLAHPVPCCGAVAGSSKGECLRPCLMGNLGAADRSLALLHREKTTRR